MPCPSPGDALPRHVAIGRAPEYGRHTAADWNRHRSRIEALYIAESKPLREVMRIMRTETGLIATAKVYKDRFRQWGVSKNAKRKPTSKRQHRALGRGHARPAAVLQTAEDVYVPEISLVLIGNYIRSSSAIAEYRPERNRDWWELLTLGMGLVHARMCEQGFRLLNLCLDHYYMRIKQPGPELILDTYTALAYLSTLPYHGITNVFAQHILQLAYVVLPATHPLRKLWATPTYHRLLGRRDFFERLADMMLDACQDNVTNNHTMSTLSNSLLCLDHLHSMGLMSAENYHRRYSKQLKRLSRRDSREDTFLHSLLDMKQALGKRDWEEADRHLEAAELCIGPSNKIMELFRILLPDTEAYDRELAAEIALLTDFSDASSPSPAHIPGSEIWSPQLRPTDIISRKTTDIFEVHYVELLKRTAELRRQNHEAAPGPTIPTEEVPQTITADGDTTHPKKEKPKAVHAEIELQAKDFKNVDHTRRMNKKKLMSWLWHWLFVGSVRVISDDEYGDEPLPGGGVNMMTVDQWIKAHFFGLDWRSPGVGNFTMQYFSIRVRHHIDGGARQIFTAGKA